jgi:hypothetical protein
MFTFNPLLAAFDLQWVFPIIFILVFVLRIIGAAAGGANNPNVPKARPPGQIPRVPRPPGNDEDALKGEIEEFLRRVSNRREGQPQQRTAANPPRPAQAMRPPAAASPQDRRRKPAPVIIASAGTPVVAEVVEAPRDDIDDHVKRYMNTRQFDQRAGQLTSIDQKERKFDQQVQQAFAHEVGHLRPGSLAPAADERSVSDSAPQVIEDDKQNKSYSLLTGSNLINAVIVSEIMQRPEHRW